MTRPPSVTIGLMAAWLAGCAPSAGPALPGSPAASGARASHPPSSRDLLYISDIGKNSVFVFSYPNGKLVQTLQGFSSPVRICSDSSGNVFVTNTDARDVLKYAHGGKTPVATYRDPNYLPTDCAVDAGTGTLAVTNYGPSGSNTGSVAVFPNGKGPAKILQAPMVQAYLFCAYDGSGNLFVDALDYSYDFLLIELPKGATKFKRIALDQAFLGWGGVQWDGKDLAIGDGISIVYDFAIKGSKGTRVRTVRLRKAINVVQFALDAGMLIGPDGPNGAAHDVGLWNYPQGGVPAQTIGDGTLENPSGAAISLATSPR